MHPLIEGMLIGLGIVFSMLLVWRLLKQIGRLFQLWIWKQVYKCANDTYASSYQFNHTMRQLEAQIGNLSARLVDVQNAIPEKPKAKK
jgi:hypothetical protein